MNLDKLVLFVVHVMVVIGILGVLFLDVLWKKAFYLIVVFLMMDILYKRYYNNKIKKNRK